MKVKRILLLMFLGALAILTVKNSEEWLRRILLYLSHASWARQIVSTLPLAKQVASRFVAGETIGEAMTAASQLNKQGKLVTLDYLGESITEPSEAVTARDEIIKLFEQIESSNLDANVSIKLTQLGLRIDKNLALNNMVKILEVARSFNNKVRIDMEESDLVDATLKIYRTLRDDFHFDNVGVVIQAYLYRSEGDVLDLIDEGAWIRLCKGAYAEPADVAFPDKADTDSNFLKLTKLMLSPKALENWVYLGVATHDEHLVRATIDYVNVRNISSDKFEFQMLFGIRRNLQSQLVNDGFKVRIYVPYGTAWYPYLVRRLAERPANLWFFISNMLKR